MSKVSIKPWEGFLCEFNVGNDIETQFIQEFTSTPKQCAERMACMWVYVKHGYKNIRGNVYSIEWRISDSYRKKLIQRLTNWILYETGY